jgi:hypothetical protein
MGKRRFRLNNPNADDYTNEGESRVIDQPGDFETRTVVDEIFGLDRNATLFRKEESTEHGLPYWEIMASGEFDSDKPVQPVKILISNPDKKTNLDITCYTIAKHPKFPIVARIAEERRRRGIPFTWTQLFKEQGVDNPWETIDPPRKLLIGNLDTDWMTDEKYFTTKYEPVFDRVTGEPVINEETGEQEMKEIPPPPTPIEDFVYHIKRSFGAFEETDEEVSSKMAELHLNDTFYDKRLKHYIEIYHKYGTSTDSRLKVKAKEAFAEITKILREEEVYEEMSELVEIPMGSQPKLQIVCESYPDDRLLDDPVLGPLVVEKLNIAGRMVAQKLQQVLGQVCVPKRRYIPISNAEQPFFDEVPYDLVKVKDSGSSDRVKTQLIGHPKAVVIDRVLREVMRCDCKGSTGCNEWYRCEGRNKWDDVAEEILTEQRVKEINKLKTKNISRNGVRSGRRGSLVRVGQRISFPSRARKLLFDLNFTDFSEHPRCKDILKVFVYMRAGIQIDNQWNWVKNTQSQFVRRVTMGNKNDTVLEEAHIVEGLAEITAEYDLDKGVVSLEFESEYPLIRRVKMYAAQIREQAAKGTDVTEKIYNPSNMGEDVRVDAISMLGIKIKSALDQGKASERVSAIGSKIEVDGRKVKQITGIIWNIYRELRKEFPPKVMVQGASKDGRPNPIDLNRATREELKSVPIFGNIRVGGIPYIPRLSLCIISA